MDSTEESKRELSEVTEVESNPGMTMTSTEKAEVDYNLPNLIKLAVINTTRTHPELSRHGVLNYILTNYKLKNPTRARFLIRLAMQKMGVKSRKPAITGPTAETVAAEVPDMGGVVKPRTYFPGEVKRKSKMYNTPKAQLLPRRSPITVIVQPWMNKKPEIKKHISKREKRLKEPSHSRWEKV